MPSIIKYYFQLTTKISFPFEPFKKKIYILYRKNDLLTSSNLQLIITNDPTFVGVTNF